MDRIIVRKTGKQESAAAEADVVLGLSPTVSDDYDVAKKIIKMTALFLATR